MRAKRIKINLNPSKESDIKILDYLDRSGVSNTKAIRTAVLYYLEHQDQDLENQRFLQQVREAVQESVQSMKLPSVSVSLQTGPQPEEEDMVSPLDFLDALAGGDSFGSL